MECLAATHEPPPTFARAWVTMLNLATGAGRLLGPAKGATEYVVKPFSLMELVARVCVTFRHS